MNASSNEIGVRRLPLWSAPWVMDEPFVITLNPPQRIHSRAPVKAAILLLNIRAADFVDGERPLSRLPELFQSMAAGNRAVKTLIRVHA